MHTRVLMVIALLLTGSLAACSTLRPRTDTQRAALVISAATDTITNFKTSNEKPMARFRALLPKAQGVVILPGVVKGGFVFAAEGGDGVLLAKDAAGRWGSPAFYFLAAGSLGFQAGAQVSDIVLLIFNENAVKSIIEHQGKLGADLGLTVGTVGMGVEAATTANVGADILAFSQGVGMYAGGSLEAAALIKRNDLNEAFYGHALSPSNIVYAGPAPKTPTQKALTNALRAALNAR